MPSPSFRPMPLVRRREPFDDPRWLYELKLDGFRSLADVRGEGVEFVSRNGNVFDQFATLAAELRFYLDVRSAVLDGEIACLDDEGRSLRSRLRTHR